MSPTHDLAVVGSGPAGAAAALTAARGGLSVALFEAQGTLGDKPCGEGLLPAGVAALRALGLDALLARGQELERIRYVLASGRTLEVPFEHSGCALERLELNAALEAALGAEPRIERIHARVETARTDGLFALRHGTTTWGARALIAADGLAGRAAAWLRSTPRGARRYGLRARAQARIPLREVEVHLGRSSEVYLTPLPQNRINVAVLCDRFPEERGGAQAHLEALLGEHPRARQWLGDWTTTAQARALARTRPRTVAEARAFLAGDAAGGIDPVLGCGVAVALTTGIAAAHAARRALEAPAGRAEAEHARFVARETRLRRGVAGGLIFLAAHPRAQDGLARLLDLWPGAARGLARRVGGAA